MPFTGTPVVTRVSGRVARITGISIASGATGTIGLNENGSAEINLPDSIDWSPYAGADAGDGVVDLEEACEVSYTFNTDPGPPDQSIRIAVTKANGGDPSAFLITFESFDVGEDDSGQLEIYIRFH